MMAKHAAQTRGTHAARAGARVREWAKRAAEKVASMPLRLVVTASCSACVGMVALAACLLPAAGAPATSTKAVAPLNLSGAVLNPLASVEEKAAAVSVAAGDGNDGEEAVTQALSNSLAALTAPSVESLLANAPAYAPTAADLDTIPSDTTPCAFALNTADTATLALSSAHLAALENARSALTNQGLTAGYLLVDLGSGRGIACDVDARVYGASSFKGPYALFLCETKLDTGEATRDTPCYEGAATAYMEGPYLTDAAASYPLGTLVEDSVVFSDNDSYRILRSTFDGSTFRSWLDDADVDAALADDTWFPRYSTREAAKLWLNVDAYLQGTSENAPWLEGLLASTEVSFIRDALADEGVTVYNKAGWITSDDAIYNGMCDAGLVTREGREYLLCVMTSASISDETEAQVEALLHAMFDAREDLV